MPTELEQRQDAIAKQAIEVAKLLGAESAREAAEMTTGQPLTEVQWRYARDVWERNWN